MPAIAWLLTFSCYGNWLPGDPRGYVELASGHAHAAPPSNLLHAWSVQRMAQPPFLLDAAARAVVDAALRDQCQHVGWVLHAAQVRTNHVHVVTSGLGPPDRRMAQLKAWATRRLREAGLIEGDRRVWARHGSTVRLLSPRAVEAACRYVVDGQGGTLPGRHGESISRDRQGAASVRCTKGATGRPLPGGRG